MLLLIVEIATGGARQHVGVSLVQVYINLRLLLCPSIQPRQYSRICVSLVSIPLTGIATQLPPVMDDASFSTGNPLPSLEIYQGLWTNWSHGPIFGRTLTISRGNADLVIAFTGVFITFIGARFWRILSMTCHRFLSLSCPQDALYHQRQVILRNSPSADSAFITFLGLCWAWHRTNERAFRRLYHLLLLSLLCTTSFVIAGGFSSRISISVGSEVLLRGRRCGSLGYYLSGDPSTVDAYAAANAWSKRTVGDASNYAKQCYSSWSSSSGGSCEPFVRPQLPGKQDTAASCPFQDSVSEPN